LWAFAQGVAGEAQPLGIRVHCLLPIMAPETEVGREALRDFSRHMGVPEAAIIEQKGMKPFVTPQIVARAVIDILSDPGKASEVGFRVSGSGVQPMSGSGR